MSEDGESGGVLDLRYARFRARLGLTLLELVVALLVLAGLLLLLVPATEHMREERRQTECRSHLRQIGLALAMYANDYGGWTPSIEPEARRIANAAGLAAGCVMTFRDTDGRYRASGLGRLQEGGYLAGRGLDVLYCPSTHGENETWVKAFSPDEDEGFWRTGKPGPTDGDGVGELPGNAGVTVSSYALRYWPKNAWGAVRAEKLPWRRACAVGLLVLGGAGRVANHDGTYNVLSTDGLVKTFEDSGGVIASACRRAKAEHIEESVERDVFRMYIDGPDPLMD